MAANILKRIEAATAERISAQMESGLSLAELRELCADPGRIAEYADRRGFAPKMQPFGCFENALRRPGMSFICEVKKASPSKGIIAPDFPYLQIAAEYETAGADCISCLTEPTWFMGSDEIFMGIRQQQATPMIRKDFTVGRGYGASDLEIGEYQIRQAKLMGADAVLLICALLETEDIRRFLALCEELGLAALVETHDAAEIENAVSAGARIIGVNNRNLVNFDVDFSNASRLRDLIPDDRIYVAESGVKSAEDVATLHQIGADAVLMGEVLMRAQDKAALLAEMRRACR